MTHDLSSKSITELMELGGVELYENLHFIYTSGKHGSGYANLRPLTEKKNLPVLRELAFRLICNTLEQGDFSDDDRIAVIGPQTLGAVIAKEGVEEYNRRDPDRKALLYGTFVHDPGNKECFLWGPRGGTELMHPDRQQPVTKVIWVDDLLNQASTWRRTKHLITDFWPEAIKAVATIADRSQETAATLGVPAMVSLRKLTIDSFEANDCPQCVKHIPIVRKPGHGHEYEKDHPDYPGGYSDL